MLKTKKILSSNTYTVPTKKGTRKVQVDSERIKAWAEKGNEMLKAGLKIPAPINHNFKDAVPIQEGNEGTIDAFKNGGFWTKFVAKEEEGKTVLYGELDVPDSLADKVGETIQETSIYVRPKYVDGLGREWEDSILHVALVTHPIEPGQENFKDGALALSMSMGADTELPSVNDKPKKKTQPENSNKDDQGDPDSPSDEPKTSNISELLVNLREVAKIDLLDDTSIENLSERLMAALRQKKLSEEEEEEETEKKEPSIKKMPKKGKEADKPLVMSQDIKNMTPEELNELVMAHPAYKAATETATNLMNHITDNIRRGLKARVMNLIRAGKITKEYADEHLFGSIDSHKVEFKDGKAVPAAVEATLKAIEAIPMGNKEAAQPGVAMSQIPNPYMFPIPANQDVKTALAMSMGVRLGDFDVPEPPIPTQHGWKSEEDMEKFLKDMGV